MRFFLISDNSDAMNGLRLAGIEGTVARSEADLRHALADAANQPDIAVLLVTEKIAETYTAVLDNARAAGGPLLITVQIADETFAKAREQLAAFAAGEKYAAWLQTEAVALAEALGENVELYARKADLPLLQGVKLPAGATLTADDTIEIGGLKGRNAAKGLAADDTLAARLDAQHEWFLQNAGLEINI